MPATTCTERAVLLLRHPVPLLPLFAFLPPLAPSTGSPLSPHVSLLPYFVSLFPAFVSVLVYSAPFTLFQILRFSRYSDLLYFAFIPINVSLFLAFIDFNLLFLQFLICLSALASFCFCSSISILFSSFTPFSLSISSIRQNTSYFAANA